MFEIHFANQEEKSVSAQLSKECNYIYFLRSKKLEKGEMLMFEVIKHVSEGKVSLVLNDAEAAAKFLIEALKLKGNEVELPDVEAVTEELEENGRYEYQDGDTVFEIVKKEEE